MTYRVDRDVFVRVRLAALAALGCTLLAVSGCASSTAADTTPVPGAANTDTYPNLNIAPKAAGEQFTTAERDAKLAALRAAQQRQSPGAVGETEEARRKRLKLIVDEQSDTLQVIESQ